MDYNRGDYTSVDLASIAIEEAIVPAHAPSAAFQ